MDQIKATIIQNYGFPNLRDNIHTHINVCKTCQKNKKQDLKYGKLPAKEVEATPWYRSLVDIIGPYKISKEGHGKNLILQALTIIYPVSSWMKIMRYKIYRKLKYQTW